MPVIDPKTGERVQQGAPQIDPATGERLSASPSQPVGLPPGTSLPGFPAAPIPKGLTNRSMLQTAKDNFNDNTQGAKPNEGVIQSALDNFGAGGGDAIRAIAHPIRTLGNTLKQPSPGVLALGAFGVGPAKEMASQAASAPVPSITRVLGQVGTGSLFGEAGGALGDGLPSALGRTGDALQDSSAGIIDKAAGLLKADFKHGANPGMGYLDGGGTPALTLRSLANKAQNVTDTAGQRLGNLYDGASTPGGPILPVSSVESALSGPIAKLRRVQGGMGGTGVSPALESYEAQMQPTLQNATARGGFTPRQLFDEVKRPIAQNTNWKDPTMFDLNTVRQQNTAAIGGLLTDAVPEAAEQNAIYQGAGKLAARATARANSGTPPFASIVNRGLEGGLGAGLAAYTHNPILAALPLALDSVAAKSTLGYGLHRLGAGANAVSDMFANAPGTPRVLTNGVVIPAQTLIHRPYQNNE